MADHVIRPGNSGVQASPHYLAVAPNDSTFLPFITRGLFIGGAGNLSVVCPNTNANVLFTGVLAGSILPIQTTRVNLTSTTVTNIVALY